MIGGMRNESSEGTSNNDAATDALHEPLLPHQPPDEKDYDNDDDDNEERFITLSSSSSEQHHPMTTATTTITTSSSAPTDLPPPHSHYHLSRNIYLTLWFQGIRCAGEAVWNNSILTAYIFLLRPNNPATIGYLSAIEGISQFVAAGISGVIGDLYRRDHLLRISSFVGIAASLLTFLSSYHQASTPIWWWSLVAIAPMLWGIFDGMNLTASLALFADSIPDGQRSYYFTLRTVSTTGGQVLGPVGALIMFALLGDEWTIADCSKVICLAQFILIPAFGLL